MNVIFIRMCYSLATTLGALTVTEQVFELLPQCNVVSRVVTDRQAVEACSAFQGNIVLSYDAKDKKYVFPRQLCIMSYTNVLTEIENQIHNISR